MPHCSMSLRTSASPPVKITSTLCGLTCGVMESITLRKSATGISFAAADALQSLPQWRQAALQRKVHSQKSVLSGCSRTVSFLASRVISSANFLRRVILLLAILFFQYEILGFCCLALKPIVVSLFSLEIRCQYVSFDGVAFIFAIQIVGNK